MEIGGSKAMVWFRRAWSQSVQHKTHACWNYRLCFLPRQTSPCNPSHIGTAVKTIHGECSRASRTQFYFLHLPSNIFPIVGHLYKQFARFSSDFQTANHT